MAGVSLNCFCVIFVLILSLVANGQRLRNNMYEDLYAGGACFRRLNGTHQTGCSSKRGGSVGVIHIVKDSSDVDWLLETAEAGPYVPVISVEMFTRKLVDRFTQKPDIIAGILVVNNGTGKPESFSHELRCPNVGSQAPWEAIRCKEEAPDTEVWNPLGSGLMHRDFPFPIFYLPPDREKDIQDIYNCFNKFNSVLENQIKRSLCAVEMNSFMFAAVNAEVCVRRSIMSTNTSPSTYCMPLSGRSLYMTLFPREPFNESRSDHFISGASDTSELKKPVKEGSKSVALVTAAMDATSLFEDDGINAVSAVSGFVILLTTSQLLRRMFPANQTTDYDKNIMLVLLNGESYDLIGSQRLAWDLSQGAFPDSKLYPLDPSSLGLHIHIGQVQGTKGAKVNAFTHDYQDETRNKIVDEFLSWMKQPSEGVDPVTNRGGRVPSSSIHSFLRLLNSSQTSMASVLVADHGYTFTNKYYHSVMDDKSNLLYKYLNLTLDTDNFPEGGIPVFPDDQVPADSIQSRLANISTALGRALYRQVTGKAYTGNLKASSFIVDELLHCYLDTMSCRLLNASIVQGRVVSDQPPLPPSSLYVGVTSELAIHPRSLALISALLSGTQVNRTKNDCNSTETMWYTWMSCWNGNGCCMRVNLNTTQALSPAFEIPDYDYTSGKFSTWTESMWAAITLRLLVRPPRSHEVMIVSVGTAVAVLSIFVLLLCRSHMTELIYTPVAEEDDEYDTSTENDERHINC